MKKIIILILMAITFSVFGQNKEAYIIYNKNGKKVNYKKLLKKASESNIILFGEIHNNPISHWLQYELTNDLSKKRELILGAEMFESSNQEVLNKYLKNEINYEAFDSIVKLWPNYKTDYAPLVELAKAKKYRFIATNIPRKYANMVYKKGFGALDTISNEEKKWIAPLPIKYNSELECYKNIQLAAHGHGNNNLPKVQAIKDATMSFFISKYFYNQHLFIHFNGAYHSDYFQGILWYLKLWKPELQYLILTTVEQSNISTLTDENKGKADFIICVDENMTKTY